VLIFLRKGAKKQRRRGQFFRTSRFAASIVMPTFVGIELLKLANQRLDSRLRRNDADEIDRQQGTSGQRCASASLRLCVENKR
jgi:hypothetical protein